MFSVTKTSAPPGGDQHMAAVSQRVFGSPAVKLSITTHAKTGPNTLALSLGSHSLPGCRRRRPSATQFRNHNIQCVYGTPMHLQLALFRLAKYNPATYNRPASFSGLTVRRGQRDGRAGRN
jgi:hypothetical protein